MNVEKSWFDYQTQSAVIWQYIMCCPNSDRPESLFPFYEKLYTYVSPRVSGVRPNMNFRWKTLNSRSVITQKDSPTNQRATNSKKNDIGPPVEMIFKVEKRLCWEEPRRSLWCKKKSAFSSCPVLINHQIIPLWWMNELSKLESEIHFCLSLDLY